MLSNVRTELNFMLLKSSWNIIYLFHLQLFTSFFISEKTKLLCCYFLPLLSRMKAVCLLQLKNMQTFPKVQVGKVRNVQKWNTRSRAVEIENKVALRSSCGKGVLFVRMKRFQENAPIHFVLSYDCSTYSDCICVSTFQMTD